MMSEQFRDRLVWPDHTVSATDRARAMTLAYRQAATAAQAQLDAVRKALASVDVQALRATDPQAATAIRDLVADAPADQVGVLDAQYSEWGEQWHADPPGFVFEDTDRVPTHVAIRIVSLNNNTLGGYRSKGVIRGWHVKQGSASTYLYQVGELRALRARLARRADRRWTAKYQQPEQGLR